jgi:starch-binding outer membrane protein SusE/F
MKKIVKQIAYTLSLVIIFASCKKDEKIVYLEGGTAPALTASKTATIPLSYTDKDKEGLTLNWTNPNYNFTTGPSSQDVTYTVEIDTLGANFTNPSKKSVAISKELSYTINQGDFNDILLNQLALKPSISHTLEVRVKSSLVNNAALLYSNVLKFAVIPYAIPPKVNPPAPGTLYITGAATPGSWMSGGDAPLLTQKFTQVSTTFFELASISLTGGNEYLLVPRYGNWSSVAPDPEKYGAVASTATVNPTGDDFKGGGNNFISPAATGNYKIQVDFQRGKFTLIKL